MCYILCKLIFSVYENLKYIVVFITVAPILHNNHHHIQVVFQKSSYSLMSRVTTSPNSIITAIVNGDAHQRSPLMDKWESMVYVLRNNNRQNYLSIICQGETNEFVSN